MTDNKRPGPLAGTGQTHPPFEPGNDLATTHGLYRGNSASVQARATEVHERILATFPELNADRLIGQVQRYCEAVAREQLGTEWLQKCVDESKAPPARLLESTNAAARLAKELADDLGLSMKGYVQVQELAVRSHQLEDRFAHQMVQVVRGVADELDLDLEDEEVRAVVQRQLIALDDEPEDEPVRVPVRRR